jgi:hypothetical protein
VANAPTPPSRNRLSRRRRTSDRQNNVGFALKAAAVERDEHECRTGEIQRRRALAWPRGTAPIAPKPGAAMSAEQRQLTWASRSGYRSSARVLLDRTQPHADWWSRGCHAVDVDLWTMVNDFNWPRSGQWQQSMFPRGGMGRMATTAAASEAAVEASAMACDRYPSVTERPSQAGRTPCRNDTKARPKNGMEARMRRLLSKAGGAPDRLERRIGSAASIGLRARFRRSTRAGGRSSSSVRTLLCTSSPLAAHCSSSERARRKCHSRSERSRSRAASLPICARMADRTRSNEADSSTHVAAPTAVSSMRTGCVPSLARE